jgi:multidrug efflux pump subunit AcrA (membrane-fusion protein)
MAHRHKHEDRKKLTFWRFMTEKMSPVALAVTLLLVAALAIGAFSYVLWSQRTIVNLSQENYNLSKASLISQNNHHAATVKAQKAQAALLKEVQQSASVIQYLGGVIIYQNAQLKSADQQIIAGQQQGHATLNAINAIEQQLSAAESSVGAKLTQGQAQINAYLGYLTCLGLSDGSGNQASCGAAPPLPATVTSPAPTNSG